MSQNITRVGSEFRINTYTFNAQKGPSIGEFSDGTFIVVWNSWEQDGSNWGIYGQKFNSNGTKVGGEFIINTYVAGSQYYPNIGTFNNGNFIIVWSNNGQGGSWEINGQKFNSNGTKLGTELYINTYTSYDCWYPEVETLIDSNFIVSWVDGNSFSKGQDGSGAGIYGQKFNSNGVRLGSEFQVHTYTIGHQWSPNIGAFNTGSFVIVWAEGDVANAHDRNSEGHGIYRQRSGIYGQKFDSNGLKLAHEFQVSTYPYGEQVTPKIIIFDDNSFIVVWNSYGQDGSGWGIYGQRFNYTGTKIGLEFQMNTNVHEDQIKPNIGRFSNGNFILTWESKNQGESNRKIHCQQFHYDGTKMGSEFQINTHSIGNQTAPDIGILTDNKYVIVWSGAGISDLEGIYGQMLQTNASTCDPVKSHSSLALISKTPTASEMSESALKTKTPILTSASPTPQCIYLPAQNILSYLYATFSLEVYDDRKDNALLPPGRIPMGWEIFKNSTDSDVPQEAKVGGYFGRAYFNKNTKEMIITHRGTELVDVFDFWNDAQMLFYVAPSQFKSASAFISHITLQCKGGINYLSFSGHSLGAALAELSTAKYLYPSVTFESPGTRDLINKLATNLSIKAEGINYAQSNILAYVSGPNIINTMKDHYGFLQRVFVCNQSYEKDFVKLLSHNSYAVYSVTVQHKMSHILDQFNSNTGNLRVLGHYTTWPSGTIIGCNGYNHYKSYDLNTFFWESYLHQHTSFSYFLLSRLKLTNSAALIGSGLLKAAIFLEQLVSKCPEEGVAITGDDVGNVVWGATNFDDVIHTGVGDDTHYLFGGNDKSYDSGGYDIYVYPNKKYGVNYIEDIGNVGEIRIGATKLQGKTYPIYRSYCSQISSNNTYLLESIEGISVFYLKFQDTGLLIFDSCDNSKNNILIHGYVWGGFGLELSTNTSTKVVVGSALGGILDCTISWACIATTVENITETILVKLGQRATLYGTSVGAKTFKILDSLVQNEDVSKRHFDTLESAGQIDIKLIKEGDYIDISNITQPIIQDNISQNGTDAFINIGESLIHIGIATNSNFINLTLSRNGLIEVNNIAMVFSNILGPNTTFVSSALQGVGTSLPNLTSASKIISQNPQYSSEGRVANISTYVQPDISSEIDISGGLSPSVSCPGMCIVGITFIILEVI